MVGVTVPAGYSGEIRVEFREPRRWLAADLVSLATALVLAARLAIHPHRKNSGGKRREQAPLTEDPGGCSARVLCLYSAAPPVTQGRDGHPSAFHPGSGGTTSCGPDAEPEQQHQGLHEERKAGAPNYSREPCLLFY